MPIAEEREESQSTAHDELHTMIKMLTAKDEGIGYLNQLAEERRQTIKKQSRRIAELQHEVDYWKDLAQQAECIIDLYKKQEALRDDNIDDGDENDGRENYLDDDEEENLCHGNENLQQQDNSQDSGD